jgi:pimeloyl-ACP methyl ester carboxylesterase
VALVRLAINLNNFVWRYSAASITPEPYRLDWPGRLRLFVEEFRASMLVTSVHVPCGRAAMRIHADSRYPPVLLVHGYGCNSGYWTHLLPLLDARGISHAGIDLEPVAGSIDGYVAQVDERVRALCARPARRRWRSSPTAWAAWWRAPGCACTAARAWRA